MKPLKIGLTGGIASGKTSAQHFFEALGIKIIDHDILAKNVVEPGQPGLEQLQRKLGPQILTVEGTLNRKYLKSLIFNNKSLKKAVEDILHPLVFQASESLIQTYNTEPYILIVSPLLVESGSAATMDQLIVVDIPEDEQLRRLIARDNITEELALAIINTQASRHAKLKTADIVLDNNKNLTCLKAQVLKAHHAILKKHSQLTQKQP